MASPTSLSIRDMTLPLSPQVLAQLRCPKTHQALRLASHDEVGLWQSIETETKTTQFLVTEDGAIAYPVEDGYPILLLERALKNADGH
jgi:uncharacterized protein YbaR (Trm112 family)